MGHRNRFQPVRQDRRHNIGVAVLVFAALGLSAASVAIVAPRPDPSNAVGRHLIAGALANLSVSVLLLVLALGPIRLGQAWGFWAYLIPLVLYGLPILVIDATHVVKEHLVTTLAPQVAGLLLSALGLWLVSAHVFRR